ncbi:MAG: hypothetical protein OXI87_11650 [Albidovulum sp.]|nr:hypothetical protein [Albidovulum sp.]
MAQLIFWVWNRPEIIVARQHRDHEMTRFKFHLVDIEQNSLMGMPIAGASHDITAGDAAVRLDFVRGEVVGMD